MGVVARPNSELIADDCQQRLDRMNDEWNDDRIRLRELDNLRPPCPTCHANGGVERLATPDEVDNGCELGIAFDPCPENGGNCDGRISWERMAAIVAEVFGYSYGNKQAQTVVEYLRIVRP